MISIVGGFDMSLARLGVRGPRPQRRFRQHQDAISGWRLISGLLLTLLPSGERQQTLGETPSHDLLHQHPLCIRM